MEDLKSKDIDGYENFVKIYEGRGHQISHAKENTFSKKVIMVLTPLEFSGCQNSQEILIQKSSMEAG